MILRCRYAILDVEAEGDGPVSAVILGPDSDKIKKAWGDRHPGTWEETVASRLLPHLKQPLVVQERIVRRVLQLQGGEPRALGYFCPVCCMFHPSDPKKVVNCPRCGSLCCPAAGCRCKERS